MYWLIASNTYQKMMRAIDAGIVIDAEQQREFTASTMAQSFGDGSRILTTAGNVAQIDVSGILTDSPDIFARIFGGGNTTYGEIIAALASADADPEITEAILAIDSPGGTVDGLFDTLAAVQAFSKPIKAVVSNVAASAAFALAAQADTIEATNPMARFGSVGVAMTIFVSDNEVTITSTEAPNKRPDVTTPEGVEMVREELDALHNVFAEAIATGRKTDVDTVNARFGQGATLVAADAVKRGMIDLVQKTSLQSVKTTTTATAVAAPEASNMDLAKLKAEHPSVYAAAMEEGVVSERDRVSAHLTMGEASGDMATAMTAIKEGSAMTGSLQATYMAAGMNRADTTLRSADDDAAGAATSAADADADADADANADAVVALVERRVGIVA